MANYQELGLPAGTHATTSAAEGRTSLLPLKAKDGYVLFELRAGITSINDNWQVRHQGEFWTVSGL